jgi:hypothetical protein
MNRARVLVSAAATLLPLLSLGCSSGTASSQPTTTCTNGTMVAADINDYKFMSSLMLHPVKVKQMSDLTFDWSGLTVDFLGHSMTPADVSVVFLLSYKKPASALEDSLNNDTFSSDNILIEGPPPSYVPMTGETSKSLYTNFQTGAGPADPTTANMYLDASMYTPSNSTFAIVAQSGSTTAGTGGTIRMLQSFELDTTSTNTTVKLTNTSTTLTYTANLHELSPTGVPAGKTDLTLDWSMLQHNALGTAMTDTLRRNIDNALVGRYTETPAQLEGKFLDLETIAQELYTTDIDSGFVLDFTTLMDSLNANSGKTFPGVNSNGTWLVALRCTHQCRNPAPYYLTILQPNPSSCPK